MSPPRGPIQTCPDAVITIDSLQPADSKLRLLATTGQVRGTICTIPVSSIGNVCDLMRGDLSVGLHPENQVCEWQCSMPLGPSLQNLRFH